ncbi:class I SAM-dependent methyltransferase [Candidatus Berkiella cookevillensis]|uniref:Class I SAM-dependent methyltransferase n=1 Tax=Candidatus Berkiella cookevillensis TaxID=437022 RepID=A0A0Q9YS51_9GAMM|nr:class I SAM-dependent methyltransferase [Candidatus Berkiella cookevillensis]MCS5707675.1 class I SAM-dependent methyltransferase [Candidatus Berkiella cookevillensis]
MENLDKIKEHFNDKKRIQCDINSYHLDKSPDYQNFDPYEKPREDFIFSLILEHYKSGSVLDVGCGVGNLVKELKSKKMDAYGIDLSSEMIGTAKKILEKANHDPRCVQYADIFKYESDKRFSLVIANGVIWYYQNKLDFLAQINRLTAEDSTIIIVHRNDLFNIFAMNEGTIHFMIDRLYAERSETDKKKLKADVLETYPNMASAISINSNLRKDFDNPLTISELYRQAGFEITSINYTYIHPFPPKFMEKNLEINYAQLQEKYGKQWQGMFLGSQFIVVAKKCFQKTS